MAWRIEFDPRAAQELASCDRQIARRIVKFLRERIARLDNPRSIGEALRGPVLGRFWKYRVGNYRLICDIRDREIVVVVIRVGHRRKIYRQP